MAGTGFGCSSELSPELSVSVSPVAKKRDILNFRHYTALSPCTVYHRTGHHHVSDHVIASAGMAHAHAHVPNSAHAP